MQSLIQYFNQWNSSWNGVLAGVNHAWLLCVLCLFTILCVFLSGICLLLYFRSNNRLKEVQKKIDTLEQKLQFQEYFKDSPVNGFTSQFNKEELKSRFAKIAAQKTEIPEKYRYVPQLERSGLGVEEVAEILDVSQNEAVQMLSLARLSNIVNFNRMVS
jgi:hypothetical protein